MDLFLSVLLFEAVSRVAGERETTGSEHTGTPACRSGQAGVFIGGLCWSEPGGEVLIGSGNFNPSELLSFRCNGKRREK